MSKTLFLYRHAKSDWDAPYGSDHARPLAKRGIKSANIIGKVLGRSGQFPELALVSTATRTKQTIELSSKAGEWNCNIHYSDDIYHADSQTILELIKRQLDATSSLMIVGHEPTTSSLCGELIGGGDIVFPTAAVCRIDFFTPSWRNIGYGEGSLCWMLQPKFFLKGNFPYKIYTK